MKKIIIASLILISVVMYFLLSNSINKNESFTLLKKVIPNDYKKIIKKYVFTHKEIEKKDITEHDASVAVGQKLVDEIVKPQLNK